MTNRKRYKKRGQSTEPFVKLTKNYLNHPAWKTLSPEARCLYIEIRSRYNGLNNGEISLSCREAATVAHCGKGTANKKLHELMEHGFIKPNKRGQFTLRHATTWILTNEAYQYQGPTNEWRQWQPGKTQQSTRISIESP